MPVSSTSNLIIALLPLVCKSYLREEAGRIVMLHKEWLGLTWKKYTKEAQRTVRNAVNFCISHGPCFSSEICLVQTQSISSWLWLTAIRPIPLLSTSFSRKFQI